MRKRLPLVLSMTALAVAVLGFTPLGDAASSVVRVAIFAKNAGKLQGLSPSSTAKPNAIPVLNKNGVLPARMIKDISVAVDNVGPRGPTGPQGPQGPAGPPGPKGATGAAGINGERGPTGASGPAGPKGEKGDKGDTGATGATGAQGPKGDTGATGATGAAGAQGPQGPQGPKGDKGDPGSVVAYARVSLDGDGNAGVSNAKGVNGVSVSTVDGNRLVCFDLSVSASNAVATGHIGSSFRGIEAAAPAGSVGCDSPNADAGVLVEGTNALTFDAAFN